MKDNKPTDSTFVALLGYAYLGAVMGASYVVGNLFGEDWRCFAWLATMLVLLALSMGVFTLVLRSIHRKQ